MKFERMFSTIDTHTGGQPTRTVIGGMPPIPGTNVAEKMLYMRDNMDWVRTSLMFEPRGHSVMSGVILVEPTDSNADYGVIFIETGGYLPMCGHDTIGVCTALLEAGMVEVKEPETTIVLETPAGLTQTRVQVRDGKAQGVTLKNIPSFVMTSNAKIEVKGYGEVTLDVAYGGNPYAILPANALDLNIKPENASQIIELGRLVRAAVNEQLDIRHPEKHFIDSCTHVEFYCEPTTQGAHVKNVVFFAGSGIDRSPCGTGTSAKLAVLHAQGKLSVGEEFVHESIIGSIFKAQILEETSVGQFKAVVPEVTGCAHVMGFNHIVIDSEDPHRHGYLLD